MKTVKYRRHIITDEDRKNMINDYMHTEMKIVDIIKKYKISKQTLYREIRKANGKL